MLQTLSELNFIPSQQPDYKEYRKYFKILDICTDDSFDLNLLRSQYQKLKLLFSQTPSNALYSLDSMSSYVVELDEAYKNLYQYISSIHKNMNSSIQNNLSYSTTPNNTDYDFPFSGKAQEPRLDSFQSNLIPDNVAEFSNTITTNKDINNMISTSTTNVNKDIDNYNNIDTTNNTTLNTTDSFIPSTIVGASISPTLSSSTPVSTSRTQDQTILNILENSDLRLGSTYKYIREYLQISLEDIQDKTKISTYYLNSIETNSFQNFQALIFLKGFFKSYLKCLKIPRQEECTNIYISNARKELFSNRR